MAKIVAAQMRGWTEKQKQNVSAIVKQSIQDVSREAQRTKAKGGRMPVNTSTLRNRYSAGLDGATTVIGPAAYEAVIAQMDMGQTFKAEWTVSYAMRMEYGFVGQDILGRTYNQPGNFFMGTALAQWQAIVDENARKVTG